MGCIFCEVTRAKMKAAALDIVGKTPQDIVKIFNEATPEGQLPLYFDEDGEIYRRNPVPPFKPYFVYKTWG